MRLLHIGLIYRPQKFFVHLEISARLFCWKLCLSKIDVLCRPLSNIEYPVSIDVLSRLHKIRILTHLSSRLKLAFIRSIPLKHGLIHLNTPSINFEEFIALEVSVSFNDIFAIVFDERRFKELLPIIQIRLALVKEDV